MIRAVLQWGRRDLSSSALPVPWLQVLLLCSHILFSLVLVRWHDEGIKPYFIILLMLLKCSSEGHNLFPVCSERLPVVCGQLLLMRHHKHKDSNKHSPKSLAKQILCVYNCSGSSSIRRVISPMTESQPLLLERAVSVWQLRALLLNSFKQEEEPIVLSEEAEDSFQSWNLARTLS